MFTAVHFSCGDEAVPRSSVNSQGSCMIAELHLLTAGLLLGFCKAPYLSLELLEPQTVSNITQPTGESYKGNIAWSLGFIRHLGFISESVWSCWTRWSPQIDLPLNKVQFQVYRILTIIVRSLSLNELPAYHIQINVNVIKLIAAFYSISLSHLLSPACCRLHPARVFAHVRSAAGWWSDWHGDRLGKRRVLRSVILETQRCINPEQPETILIPKIFSFLKRTLL